MFGRMALKPWSRRCEVDRISFFGAGKPTLYRRIVTLLVVDLYQLTEAFHYVERSRSRAFLDLLAQGTSAAVAGGKLDGDVPLPYLRVRELLRMSTDD